jgi:hypothetical protein
VARLDTQGLQGFIESPMRSCASSSPAMPRITEPVHTEVT